MSSRYGGEEFAVLLPNTNLTHVVSIAEAIRLGLVNSPIAHPASDMNAYITVSLGVAGVTPNSDDAGKALLGAADKALYSAKSAGRNRSAKAIP